MAIPKPVIFLTKNGSFAKWQDIGSLNREIRIYYELSKTVGKIGFVSYGKREENILIPRFPNFQILHNKWRLPNTMYANLLPYFFKKKYEDYNIIKTNQTLGSDIARKIAKKTNKKLIARCGYLYSDFIERQYGIKSKEAIKAIELERRIYSEADSVVVTTNNMKDNLIERYSLSKKLITVIPNYVQTDIFKPSKHAKIANRIIFVGRLAHQKNVLSLIESVVDLDIELLIIGNGPLYEKIQRQISNSNVNATIQKRVNHNQIPHLLNQASIFILPSHYEGHPKTLIEAMACGLAVIGTKVPGIREVIDHNKTGYLCGTEPKNIREAIILLLNNHKMRRTLGKEARKYTLKHFAVDKITNMELELYNKLLE
jgi:glycosyltransferase involved in cell wall biosynthesis